MARKRDDEFLRHFDFERAPAEKMSASVAKVVVAVARTLVHGDSVSLAEGKIGSSASTKEGPEDYQPEVDRSGSGRRSVGSLVIDKSDVGEQIRLGELFQRESFLVEPGPDTTEGVGVGAECL